MQVGFQRCGLNQINELTAERCPPPPKLSGFSTCLDSNVPDVESGQERTEAEFRDLFAAAGLRLQRVIPTASPSSVLEAVLG